MCLTCGCHLPNNPHSDPRHITLRDLKAAANAADISPSEAVNNLVDTFTDVLTSEPG